MMFHGPWEKIRRRQVKQAQVSHCGWIVLGIFEKVSDLVQLEYVIMMLHEKIQVQMMSIFEDIEFFPKPGFQSYVFVLKVDVQMLVLGCSLCMGT